MAMTPINGGMVVPFPQSWQSTSPSIGVSSAVAIDASGEKMAVIFPAPKTGTLDKFEVRIGSVANNPDNGLRFSFQNIDANADPDGVQDQFRDYTTPLVANTWIAPGLMTSDGTDGGVKRSVTKGDMLACVIEFANFVAGDSVGFTVITGAAFQSWGALGGRVFGKQFTTAWSAPNFDEPLIMALKYDDGTYAFISHTLVPYLTVNNRVFNTSSTPDERGLRFQVPFECEIDAVWIHADLDAAGLTGNITLYDASDNVLTQIALDDDEYGSANFMIPFPDAITLSANTTYRITVTPTFTPTVTMYDYDVVANAYLGAVGGGIEWYSTERTNGGAWTDTPTNRPFMGIRISGVEVSGSSGGGTTGYAFIG